MEIIIAPRTSQDLGEYRGFQLRGYGWDMLSDEFVAWHGMQFINMQVYRAVAIRGPEDASSFMATVTADKNDPSDLLRVKSANALASVKMHVDDFLEPRR